VNFPLVAIPARELISPQGESSKHGYFHHASRACLRERDRRGWAETDDVSTRASFIFGGRSYVATTAVDRTARFPVDTEFPEADKACNKRHRKTMKVQPKFLVVFLTLFAVTQVQAMRWYSPSTGNWFSRDPLGEPGFELQRRANSLRVATGVENLLTARRFEGAVALKPRDSRPVRRGFAELLPEGPNISCFVGNNPLGGIDPKGLDVYKIVIPADLSSGGSSVDHREIVGDDGKGGVYVLNFNQCSTCGIHILGASIVGKGEVTVSRASNISAENWIKENGGKAKKWVATPHDDVDKIMSDYADAYTKTKPFYILGFNDCGSIANRFMEEAERAVRRWDDRNSEDF